MIDFFFISGDDGLENASYFPFLYRAVHLLQKVTSEVMGKDGKLKIMILQYFSRHLTSLTVHLVSGLDLKKLSKTSISFVHARMSLVLSNGLAPLLKKNWFRYARL